MTSITHELPTHHKRRRRNVLKKERELSGTQIDPTAGIFNELAEGGLLGQASTSGEKEKKKRVSTTY
jgi:hypothetical protein